MSLTPVTPADRVRQETSVALKHLCSISADYGANIASDAYVPSGLRFLRTTDISAAGSLHPDHGVYVQERDAGTSILRSGDLLISRSGTIGRAFLYNEALHGRCAFAGYLVRFRPRHNVSGRFLFYWTKSTVFETELSRDAIQSTIQNFNGQKYANMRLVAPTLETQRAIADFLDRKTAAIDALIEKKERLIALLEEKRQALITQAVTKGLDPSVPMKDSGIEWLGEIPAHWDVQPLMHLTPPGRAIMYGIVLPGPHVEGGIPIVKSGDCRPERLKRDQLKCTTPEIEAAYARARLQPGDIVYSIRGSVGSSAIVPSEVAGANLTQDAARIAPRPGVDSEWLWYAVQSGGTWAQLEAGIVGATVKGINIRDLKRPKIPVPPVSEQAAIAHSIRERLKVLEGVHRSSALSVERLREYRQALITAAVTGQLDVATLETA